MRTKSAIHENASFQFMPARAIHATNGRNSFSIHSIRKMRHFIPAPKSKGKKQGEQEHGNYDKIQKKGK
jgi:hypothetical protein